MVDVGAGAWQLANSGEEERRARDVREMREK